MNTKLNAKKLIMLLVIFLVSIAILCAKEGDMFPSFEGTDLNGNPVDQSIFLGKVTVVNFWFSTCPPCLAELGDLDALDKELRQKGGMVVGINVDTLNNNTKMIEKAKSILKAKNASYMNITFSSKSPLGKLVSSIYAYPTTYVLDKEGKIVGSPILGAITSKATKAKLMSLIEQALAKK